MENQMKRIILLLCLVLSLTIVFCACGEGKDNGTDSNVITVKAIENVGSIKLVRADKASDEIKASLTSLHNAISDATGERLSVGTDWSGDSGTEIIIGNADRTACEEAAKLLKTDFDYLIKLSGQHIVIMGLNDESTIKAVNYYIDNFIIDGKLYYPSGNGYIYSVDTKVDSFKIGGVDISEYQFHYIDANGLGGQSTYSEVLAIRDRLGNEYVGKILPISNKDTNNYNMICYDRSGLDYEKCGIKMENGDLYIYGSYHSIGYAVDYFFDTLIGENGNVDIPADFSVELSTADKPDIYSKDDLMSVLEYVYNTNDLLIVGDEVNNSRCTPSTMLEPYYESTGTHPSIMGLDLGRCGFKMPTLPDDQWMIISQMICESVEYAADGGIITIGCHMTNPSFENPPTDNTEDRGEVGNEQAWIDLVTEGTDANARFKSELELDAIVLEAFEEAGVPIIWRPFHECNGGWFWWTPKQGDVKFDAKYFVDMWKYVYEFFTEERGLTNLIWEYSPSTSTYMDVMYLYPGDEYCDIVGIDWYTSGNFEIDNTDGYEKLMATGKVTNLAEIGPSEILFADTPEKQVEVYSAEQLIGNAYSMYYEDYKIGYFMTYAGKTSLMWPLDGAKVMKDKRVLELAEMLPLFEKVTGFKPNK